ncbi:hypothetical protein HK101_002947 [Irineochytrium annulatum]|nr:hypothetical protein HK101_002947 [Irineochytrium annulatum]
MDHQQLDPLHLLTAGPDVAALAAFSTSVVARDSIFPIAASPRALALGALEARRGNFTASASAFRGGDYHIGGANNMQHSKLRRTTAMSMPSPYPAPSQAVSIRSSAAASAAITTIAPTHSSDEAARQASQTLAVLSRSNNGNYFHQQRDPNAFITGPPAHALHPSTQLLANKAAGSTSKTLQRVKVPAAEQPAPASTGIPDQPLAVAPQSFACYTLAYDPATSTFHATGAHWPPNPAPGDPPHAAQALDVVNRALSHLLATYNNPCKRDRLAYALAGQVFKLKAPHPFGGQKKDAGFLHFDGHNVDDVLSFIVSGMFATSPAKARKKKKPSAKPKPSAAGGIDADATPLPPSFAFVIACLNDVIDIFLSDEKDEMDQLVVRGMVRAGHLSEEGRIWLPRNVRGTWVWKYRESAKARFEQGPRRKVSPTVEGHFGVQANAGGHHPQQMMMHGHHPYARPAFHFPHPQQQRGRQHLDFTGHQQQHTYAQPINAQLPSPRLNMQAPQNDAQAHPQQQQHQQQRQGRSFLPSPPSPEGIGGVPGANVRK